MFDAGEVESLGEINAVAIYLFTPNDKHYFLIINHFTHLFQRVNDGSFWDRQCQISAQNNIGSVGEGFDRKRLPRLSAHHDGMAGSEFLEAAQVCRKVAEQLVVETDFVVEAGGYDDAEFCHSANWAMRGWEKGAG